MINFLYVTLSHLASKSLEFPAIVQFLIQEVQLVSLIQ